MRSFAAEAVEALANLDGRLFRTLRLLLTRPGELTAEYFAGRRTPYLRPLQLFVLCNVFFFLAQGLSQSRVLDTPLNVHVHYTAHREVAHRLAYGRPHVEGEAPSRAQERMEARFDQAVQGQSRTLVILMVPMMALALAILFVRRRRYFLEHLVFATHFYAFLLLLTPLLVWALIEGVRLLARIGVWRGPFGDNHLALPILLLWAAYLAAAVRRFYGDGLFGATWRGVLLAFAVMQVLAIYRVVLFFTAFWSARA